MITKHCRFLVFALTTVVTLEWSVLSNQARAELVLWLNFDDNTEDQSGNENDGEILSDASFDTDVPAVLAGGKSLLLENGDLESNGVRVEGSADLTSETFTLAYWIKPTALQGNAGLERLTSRGGDAFETAIGDRNAVGGGDPLTLSYFAGSWETTEVTIEENEWSHVAWRNKDDGDLDLFVNGELEFTGVGVPPDRIPEEAHLNIGTRHNEAEGFEGLMDELRLYDTALSDAEILALAVPPPDASPLVGVWLFDGDTKDSSDNGNDGELIDGEFSDDVPDIPRAKGGKSLLLEDGAHVLVGHAESLNITTAITIAAWVKPVGEIGWDGILAKNPSEDSSPNHAGNYELRIDNGDRQLHFLHQQGAIDDTVFHKASDSIIEPDVWTHIAVTGDTETGDVHFYINGELNESLEGIIPVEEFPINENPLFIGSRADLFTPFDGLLDEVVLSSAAFDADEVNDLFRNGPPIRFKEIAYKIEEGVEGNQDFQGALGMDFIVTKPIQVLELGAFDSSGDELMRDITVELWTRDDGGTPDDVADDTGGDILASLEFSGDAGSLEGGSRFLPLASPVVLTPGPYTIVGWGYGPDEPNYNVGGRDAAAEGLTLTELDFLEFVGGSRFGDPGNNGQFPDQPDGGPVNRYGAGTFKFTSTGDSDGDGMSDVWEESFGLNKNDPSDAGLDPDNDGLTNLEEHERGTAPNLADTDKDGLNDNVETNTGTWVSAANTGTNPNRADTDRDGLLDGVETNTGVFVSKDDTGTNPFLSNTDGDRAGSDGAEVNNGTDPNAGQELPLDAGLVGYWPLDTDLMDVIADSHGELMDGEDDVPDFADGKLGGALSLDGIGEFVEINPDNEPLFDGFDDDGGQTGFTISTWFKVNAFEKSWQALVAKGEGNRWRIHRRGGESVMTGNGGNADVSAGSTAVDDDEWHHLALISIPDEGVELYVDGELEGTSGPPNLEDNDLPMMIGENPDARGRTWNGLVDDLAFWNRALSESDVRTLWNDGEGRSPIGGTSLGFQITEAVYTPGDPAKITVTWQSRAGESFIVEQSTDVQNWEELTDGLDSEGDTTSFEIDVSAPIPKSLYVRVRKEG